VTVPTGIVGTPVIDTSTQRMYFISKVMDASSHYPTPIYTTFNNVYPGVSYDPDYPATISFTGFPVSYVFHAVNLANGQDLKQIVLTCSQCQAFDPNDMNRFYNTFNPAVQLQRPGLLLAQGHVIAGFGSYADRWPWQGWLFSFNVSDPNNIAQDGSVPLIPFADTTKPFNNSAALQNGKTATTPAGHPFTIKRNYNAIFG
jgi:hypothetical protein